MSFKRLLMAATAVMVSTLLSACKPEPAPVDPEKPDVE